MKFAMFTIVKDETFHLPVWCDYYARAMGGDEHIYVIDDHSSDGCVERARNEYQNIKPLDIPKSGTAFDHKYLQYWVKHHQRELLAQYDVVGFAEVDEFLFPFGETETLRHYVERRFVDPKLRYVAARGYEVIHRVDTERPITTNDERLMSDRNSMWWSPGAYSKTLISREPLPWIRGFHRLSHESKVSVNIHDGFVSEQDLFDTFAHRGSNDLTGLNLLHTQLVDLDVYHARYAARQKMNLVDVPQGNSDREQCRQYFLTRKMSWSDPPGLSHFPVPGDAGALQIPERWKRELLNPLRVSKTL